MKKIVIIAFAAAAFAACGVHGSKTAAGAGETGTAQTKNEETTMMYGGYTAQRPLGDRDKELFRNVTEKLEGVKYTPESVATQVVAGMNYRFVCTAETVARNPETFRAEVTVYQPLPGQGEARITGIRRL